MKKRVLTALMITMVTVSSLAACGSSAGGSGDNASAEAATTQSEEAVSQSTSEPAEAEPEEEEEAPAAPTPGTLPAEVTIEGAIDIPASDAEFSAGEGLTWYNEKAPTEYNEECGLIINLAQDGTITYTVPEGADGSYDIYLTVSKSLSQYTSQVFTFSVNGGEAFSVPVECDVPADSFAKFSKDGDDYNTGTLMDSARFLICRETALAAGDTFEVTAAYGARAGNMNGISFPNVGDLLLAPAGSEVPTGYDDTVKTVAEGDPSDPLAGKTIFWIGSSVTYGAQSAGHYSMVDAIRDNHPGSMSEKYAISATTLVNDSESSYVNRLKLIPKDKKPDLIVVQLSTNDATTGKEFGEVSDSTDINDFDDKTIAGAIETIIAYARDTFNCPVAFYTGTYCEKENYAEMVDLLHEIEAKWDILVIDMFNNEEMTALYGTELYDEYMGDEVHPSRKGYVEWWTPVIDAAITEYFQ